MVQSIVLSAHVIGSCNVEKNNLYSLYNSSLCCTVTCFLQLVSNYGHSTQMHNAAYCKKAKQWYHRAFSRSINKRLLKLAAYFLFYWNFKQLVICLPVWKRKWCVKVLCGHWVIRRLFQSGQGALSHGGCTELCWFSLCILPFCSCCKNWNCGSWKCCTSGSLTGCYGISVSCINSIWAFKYDGLTCILVVWVCSLVLMGWLQSQYLHPEITYALNKMAVWWTEHRHLRCLPGRQLLLQRQ